ncbi:SusC/RagA family TonB-linked outer membrane protein [Flavihumibacter rivuli]|uniref:SusC/RagA family TonB-linked outer membrane protein n=1 Tax=Flavihumibacter rivuli TaxID=2838156 RepID=UPI001BDEB49D|nr:SusC/RagA family TonB-linked outer membrane protein [Flavihumibacter rivuli]ULQ56226.1 SusC/RagA family TonB-linked outer membrane protein [Flavihumibacter rivuli]
MHISTKLAGSLLFLLLSASIYAQQKIIKGTVRTKENQQLLNGVTIRTKNGVSSSVTQGNGGFEISAHPNDTLILTHVGFKPLEIPVSALNENSLVDLERGESSLNEVVVTALGISRKRKSVGYAVQELKSKDFAEAREPNIVSALEGKLAGVRITNSQGDMGSSRIIIRGETSIAGNNQPLFILNGVPVDNSQLGVGGSRDYANAIADINPDDIESISVLKGPNAAALYGSRAAAGVILIKTKSGKSKKGIGITFNTGFSIEQLLTLPSYQNTFGQGSDGKFSYVDGRGGGINDGVDESWGPRMDGRLIPQFYSNGEPVPFVPHPNNVKDFFRNGYILNNGISIADATEKVDYRISFNNFKQEGVVPNSSQGRNTVSLNTTLRLTPKLSFIADANYYQNRADNLPGAGGRRATSTMLQFTWFGRQVDINRLKNYRNPDGSTFNWNNSYYSNPFFIAYENTVEQRRNRFIGKAGFNYKIIEGLQLNFFTGTDYYNDRRKLKVAYGTNGTPFGSYQEDGYTVNETNTEATLNYKKSLPKDLSIDLVAGGNIRSKFYEENIQQAPRLAVAGLYSLANSRDPLISSNYYSKLLVYSLFGAAQIGYKDFAFLNLTARNDWSSTLPTQNRSYFYPSINGSLILTEAFNIKSDWLSYAKLRAGWSKVGKDADPYQLRNTFLFSAPFGSYPQLTASGIDLNQNLKPETTTSEELGAELAFIDNKVRLDISVYNTNSYNQILSVDVSPSTGYRQKLLNAGKINNKGLEIQLGLTPVKGPLTWDVSLNYAQNRSKVIKLDEEGRLKNYVIGTNSAQVIATVGQPYGTLFGNAYLRNDQGQILVNADGAPRIDPTKRVLGKYTPDWFGGVTNSFTYKGINLSVLIDGSFGGQLYSGTYATGTYTGVLSTTLPGRGAENGGLYYYYPDNKKSNGTVQLPGGATAPNGETIYDDGIIFNGVTSDGKPNTKVLPAQQYYKSFRTIDEANIFDASFVKLREVRVSYSLPKSWISKLRLHNATVSAVGRNLWIIYKAVPHIDPETAFNTGNAQGLESLSLPTVRSYGFNLSLQF